MSQLPDVPRNRDILPEPRLTPEQFEQVIRRASELQSRRADDAAGEGITHAELIRIGREVGLSPQHIQQALAETMEPRPAAASLPERVFGVGAVAASRVVPGDPVSVQAHVEAYLLQREWLAVLRRFPDRTVYQRAAGLQIARAVDLARSALLGGDPAVGAGFKLRNTRRVEVAARPLEDGFTYVTLRADLRNYRTGFATAGVVGGGGIAGGIAATLAVAIDPAAALVGIPALGASMWGFRAMHGHVAEHAQTHLEALLDCLERGEPLVRARAQRR